MTTEKRKRRSRSTASCGCFALVISIPLLIIVIGLALPGFANRMVGPASDELTFIQRIQYSGLVLWYDGLITQPFNSAAKEVSFRIEPGDGASLVAARLELAGIIGSADAFTAYLVYSGLDIGLQAGDFQLSPAQAPIQIAKKLQDATPTQVQFIILPGWRLEEVAAAMPTSGLGITPEQFIQAALNPGVDYDFMPGGVSAEGLLLPGEYLLPRDIKPTQLVKLFMDNTALALSPELRQGFARQGLNVYQAIILASIVQREAIIPDEQPVIASVFINRLAANMRLETDPTIQYAIGFDVTNDTWWKVPLSLDDLAIVSSYNTYQNAGLPPGPICSPSISALQSVAYPAQTPYYYFRARCDGSRLHNFAETFEQHLQNGCN